MDGSGQQQRRQVAPIPGREREGTTAIVSGEETHLDDSSSDDDENDDGARRFRHGDPNDNGDELYCDNADDEDEAWVYRHLRGGREEVVNVRRPKESDSTCSASPSKWSPKARAASRSPQGGERSDACASTVEQVKMLKPRNSDAVLSCPCCFNIVCMDCQQHERYPNQYRAMFVMNVGVHWESQMVYDEASHELKPRGATSTGTGTGGGPTGPDKVPRDDEEFYYNVYCLNCRTVVAALNMEDEVYHFFGCVASG